MASVYNKPLLVVSSYTQFDNLAHGPTGTEATHSMWTFELDQTTGRLLLLSVVQGKDDTMNPAFSRKHPHLGIMYACTESVSENGKVVAWNINAKTGKLNKFFEQDALGTSTCYITIDKRARNMLIVNYWDASIHVFGLNKAGEITGHLSKYDPNEGREMVAASGKHVNHSVNDASAQAERQADPHSHSIIVDPFYGEIAFVPDLGMDSVRQFHFDPNTGVLTPYGKFSSGVEGTKGLGPRYIEFHPTLPVCYVINELSSEVAVFAFDHEIAKEMIQTRGKAPSVCKPSLKLIQTIRTVPSEWPMDMNTCGRIAVHPLGGFVLCSNRGHDSIACFRVHPDGRLSLACIQHTHGATPRHFQFDPSGQWIVAANQDSDNLAVFRFNLATGSFQSTGVTYTVPSPNFVCAIERQAEQQPAKVSSCPFESQSSKL